jgi:hypothetical protein
MSYFSVHALSHVNVKCQSSAIYVTSKVYSTQIIPYPHSLVFTGLSSETLQPGLPAMSGPAEPTLRSLLEAQVIPNEGLEDKCLDTKLSELSGDDIGVGAKRTCSS